MFMRRCATAVLTGLAIVTPVPGTVRAQSGLPSLSGQSARHFAIQNARLVTVSGRVMESSTIVIEDGLITAIGDVEAPAGAWVIDGSGLTVYPGLIDGLGRIGLPAPPQRSNPFGFGPGGPGAGPPIDPADYSWGPEDRPATSTWVQAADEIDVDADELNQWRTAGFASAITVPTTGFFPGHAALINLAGERPRELVLMNSVALRLNLQGGPEHRGYPGSLMGALSYVKQFFIDAQHYHAAWDLYNSDPNGLARPTYDRALDPLGDVLGGSERMLFPASSRAEIGRALRTSDEIGVRPIIYGAHQAYDALDALRGRDVPVLVGLNWPAAPRDGDPEADVALQTMRHRLMAPTTPARLREAGIPFAFYTEGLRNPSEVRGAVRQAVEAGLDHDDAVRALTLSAAEIYGAEGRLGSLDVGKIANLVVTDGDLFGEDTEIRMVFVDGRQFEPTAEEENARPAFARGGGGRGGLPGAGPRRRRPGTDADPDDSASTPSASDAELRSRIGESLRGPYRDDAVTVIQNATILTVTNGTIEGGSVLIRDGKIAEIGTDISVPNGAHVIDAAGQYVMPGVIDAHSHIAVSGGVNEGSIVVSSMVGIEDVIDPDQVSIYRALAGGVTSANILHGSANPIGGKNAVIKLRWGQDADGLMFQGAPPGIKFALGENTKRDRNPDRYPNTRMGVIDVIRQAFVDAQEYQADWAEYEAKRAAGERAIPPIRNRTLEPLVEILRGDRLVHAHSYRADEILQLVRLAEEFDFRIGTFQHVLEGYKVAKEIAEHGAGASTFSDWWAYKVEAYDAIPYNAAIMTEKGVVVSLNSDSGEEMRHLNEEAAKTIHWGGLSEDEALALVTINPAIQLGVDDRVGSIEIGKDADLVIYDRHPLDNLAVVQKTFVDGKLFFDIEGDRARQQALEAEKEALKERGERPRITLRPSGEEVDR